MTVFNLPDLGEGLPDAEIVQWLVKEGDEVEAGDAIVEVSTAKAVVEVPAPHSGKVTRLHGRPGDVIDTGAALITIAEDGEDADTGDAGEEAAPKSEAKPKAKSEAKKSAPAKPAKGGAKGHIFNLPDLGEGLPDAEIVQWLVKEGDEVEAGDAMVEMSTAKAVVEVPAPHTGRVVKIYGGPGDVIDTGNPLVVIDTGEGGEVIAEDEAQTEAPAEAAEPKTEKVREDAGTVVGEMIVGDRVTSESRAGADGVIASAAVRALARKLKVNLTAISGSGPDGEVTLKDVRGAESGAAPPATPAAQAAPEAVAARGEFKIGPAADLLATSLGLDPSAIPAADGATITKQDVLAAARARLEGAAPAGAAARLPSGDASLAAGRGVKAAPKVRAYARDKGVELGQARASGPAGSVTMADVDRVMADFRVEAPAATTAARYALPPRAYDVSGKPEKLVGPRRVMSQMMAKANAEVCHTSIFDEADISSWPKGVDITARLMRSIIAAAMDEPALNAWFDGGEGAKTVHRHVNLGVAVDSPKGLFVPVVQGADSMSPEAMRKQLDALRQAIADGSIQPKQMSGATITLSNYGMLAGRFATPIITPPQVAIVGIGGLYDQLVMTDKGIENHRFVPVSVTFDHRACTGGEAARYLAGVLKDLESSV